MLTIDEITSHEELSLLEAAWQEILTYENIESPFLDIDWFRCCLEAFGVEKQPCVLFVKDGSDPLGIAPLCLSQDIVRGIPVRKIGFIIAPDTPFVDFIVKSGRRQETLSAIMRYLWNEKNEYWDILTLNDWPSESRNYPIVNDILMKRKANSFEGYSSVTPYISIKGTWDRFLECKSSKFRKTRRNIVNRMERLEDVAIDCIQNADVREILGEIYRVSERSWKQREGKTITSSNDTRRFFEILTPTAARKGWLFVWLLKVDGTPIAMEYNLKDQGRVYALRADYDESFREFSPGRYLEYHIIESLFERGCNEYNTGPGLNAYKLHWTEKVRENKTIYICNTNYKGHLIWILEGKLIPIMRRLRDLRFAALRWMKLDGCFQS
jgi:CelD/BcsL family acetyltransferase involved in cellulose biosynthesis